MNLLEVHQEVKLHSNKVVHYLKNANKSIQGSPIRSLKKISDKFNKAFKDNKSSDLEELYSTSASVNYRDALIREYSYGYGDNYKKLLTCAELIEDNKPDRVLDLGCGIGTYLLPLTYTFTGSYFTGVDINQNQLDFIKKMEEDIYQDRRTALRTNVQVLPKPQFYDFILCMDVIEHTIPDEFLLQSIMPVTKSGTLLVIYAPFDVETDEPGHINSNHPSVAEFRKHLLRLTDTIIEHNGIKVVQVK